MATTILSAVIALISAVSVSVISHFLLLKRVRKEGLMKLKTGFFEKQITAYQQFWNILGPLSRYYPADDIIVFQKEDKFFLRRDNARKFFLAFRDFFYSENGIFLSKELRGIIFKTRDLLENIIAEHPDSDEVFKISNGKAKRIFSHFDQIHTVARNDLGLRDMELPKEIKNGPAE